MSPTQFKAIRERLGLSQEELAQVLCLSGKKVVSNIETGVRNPGRLVMVIMQILDELSAKKAKELMGLLQEHNYKLGDRENGNR
ncbi:MAG: helix-turn-helix domain-containing protein [Pseudobdellovibrionaceae bacterium]